ncbi:Maf family protein [Tepidimonas charontis]|uniref:dTTP/UTP pyrophosphatase n=1 Tax=Tepidimonas charontis TaxID=2267262 RepID=A0A554XHT2_9BURK|nr:Maf family protein [Tepidimonas charontis]TSE35373.1 Maf-like protein YhdE [Tepidimonas charontis]
MAALTPTTNEPARTTHTAAPAVPADGRPWVYLASQSPRRRDLLLQWGVTPVPLPPDPEEDAEALEAVQPGEAPAAYVRRVTRAKLRAAQQRLRRRGWPPGVVLCADTTVALYGAILGKPADAAEAAQMLRRLSGRVHHVLTAVAVASPLGQWRALSRSRVWFADLSEADIAAYVASGEPMGKAGAYAIQGRAALWVRRISGSHSGIVGLPAFETGALLRRAGVALR